jgi:hypothetical protein
MIQTRKNAAILALVGSLLVMTLFSSAYAQTDTTATLTGSAPDENGVITVSGSGFNASETVSFALYLLSGEEAYAFPETATTDSNGDFTANLTLPTGISGTFDLTAQTSSVVGYMEYIFSSSDSTGSTPMVSATPSDSNIIQVVGSGFDASDAVILKLEDSNGETVYIFSDTITTDADGNFSTIAIIPTSISGEYSLTATTSSTTASTSVAVPDLTGPTGATGATGATGETGATGAAGAADSTLGYGAIGLSVLAVVIALFVLMKKR